jgi:dienelactone hydrolase
VRGLTLRVWLAIAGFAASPVNAEIAITAAPQFDPLLVSPVVVSGALPNEKLTVVATRQMTVWRPDAQGNWGPVPVDFIAWAEFLADSKGRLHIGKATPMTGSYAEPDPLGLFWSGYPADGDAVPASFKALGTGKADRAQFRVLRGDIVIAENEIRLSRDNSNLRVATVQQPGLVGVFAAPKDGKRLPTLIVLHGSEGNNIEKARNNALSYAAQGFATFAVAWYTQPYEPTEHVPSSGLEIDVNQLERARAWLDRQPEADAKRIGLFGTSKGGEFAMLAASRFPWVKAAVGCVPSDIVWQGFGEGENVLPVRSTWQLDGRALPFVPLYPYVDGRFRDNTDRYERSRRFNADAAQLARIPIEKTKARLLLIAGDLDEVWASGAMARNIAETMQHAGKGKQVETLIAPKAGHGVCGDGSFPVRAYGKDDPDPDRKSLNAEGHATVTAFRRTVAFLKSVL